MENRVAPDDTLTNVKRRFSEARDLTAEARRECLVDDDYKNGYQWTPAERRALASRKQPDLVFNRIRPALMGMLGVVKQGRTDPRAWGRNPDDDETADVATKILRYVADKNDFEAIRMAFAEDNLGMGTGACIVEMGEREEVKVEQIRWEEFFYDPRSRRHDFKDANYLGVAKWVYADYIARTYGVEPDEINNAIDAATGVAPLDPSFMDRPMGQLGMWYDRNLRRCLLVEMYYNDTGEWQRIVFYGDKTLEHGPSPYVDQYGKPVCPIEAQSCYIDRENARYGVIRDMRGPQDEINKRRSKLLHLLNNRQVWADSDLALNADAKTVRDEAARPDGVLPAGWKPVALTDIAAAQMNLLQEAKMEVERQSPNPAILGRQPGDESGRAHLVRQQAGLTELAVVLGGVEKWELRVYRQIWDRVRQFWKAPQFVRVTDDRQAPEFVGINQPVVQTVPAIVAHPVTGQPVMGQRQVVLGYKNNVAEMDVDITLDVTPHNANVEAEQFQMLVDLRRSGVPIDPIMLLQASSLPGKYKIIQAMEEQQQQPNPMQQLQQAGAQAEVQLKQADAQHRVAQANKLQAETVAIAQEPHNDLLKAGAQAYTAAKMAADNHAIASQETDIKKLALLGQWMQAHQDEQQQAGAA